MGNIIRPDINMLLDERKTKNMKKFYCELYVKIYCDGYPSLEGDFTGDEIFEYLTSDMCAAHEPFNGNMIEGDHRIWYYGCNEKLGVMIIEANGNKFERVWGMVESSFNTVRDFISFCKHNEVFTEEQVKKLLELVEEGEKVDNMYKLGEYLDCKNRGVEFKKKDMREQSKAFFSSVKKGLEKRGYRVYEAKDFVKA